MKKVLLIVAFLLILIAIPLTVFLAKQSQDIRQRATASSSLYIEPATIIAQPNEQFEVEVKMETAQNQVAAAEIHLSFSALYLEAVTIQAGDFLPSVLQSGTVNTGTASITVGAPIGSSSIGVNGTGVVARITFKALAETDGSTPIQFNTLSTQISAIDDQGTNVLAGTSGTQVTIGTGTGVLPSTSPQASPLASPLASATPGATPQSSPLSSPSSSPSNQSTQITAPAQNSTVTSKRPTISVVSFPNALIVLSISNTQITYTNYANSSGNFTYTPTIDLANGTYTLTVTGSDTSSGTPETASTTFIVNAGGTGGTTLASPSPGASTIIYASPATTEISQSNQIPVTGNTEMTILLFIAAVLLVLFGSTKLLTK